MGGFISTVFHTVCACVVSNKEKEPLSDQTISLTPPNSYKSNSPPRVFTECESQNAQYFVNRGLRNQSNSPPRMICGTCERDTGEDILNLGDLLNQRSSQTVAFPSNSSSDEAETNGVTGQTKQEPQKSRSTTVVRRSKRLDKIPNNGYGTTWAQVDLKD